MQTNAYTFNQAQSKANQKQNQCTQLHLCLRILTKEMVKVDQIYCASSQLLGLTAGIYTFNESQLRTKQLQL